MDGCSDRHVRARAVRERSDHGQEQNTIHQAHRGQNYKRDAFPCELVQDSAERRRHEAPERDESERDPQRAAPRRFLRVSVRDHRDPGGVRERRAQTLQAARREQRPVVIREREDAGGDEHDQQPDQQRDVVPHAVDEGAG